VIVGVIRRKPVLTHASIVCEGMLASVNSVNSVKQISTGFASWLRYCSDVAQRIKSNQINLLNERTDRPLTLTCANTC